MASKVAETAAKANDLPAALGEKKAADITPAELAKLSPEQQLAVIKKANAEGKEDKGDDESSLKIHIKLDLDVEVHLTARVKGDITIGLL